MNGVGGRTIAEAKLNMTNAEVSQWAEFRNKYGSLFFGRRIEQATGNLLATYLSSKGAQNVKALSFMPHEEQPQEMSLEEYMLQTYGGE